MTLNEFLKETGKKESDILNYSGEEALIAVKEDGYALRYVRNQTEEICLEAVKQEGYALRYVKNQTEEICLEAVKQDGDAIIYVDKSIFDSEVKEMTLSEITKILGYDIKIVKEKGEKE